MTTIIARGPVMLVLAATALPVSAPAQEPQLINYEGRVAVNGLNFKGRGHFKFALVDPAGTASYWSHDGTSTAGSEPVSVVTLTVTKGRYSVLLGDTTLPNMTSVPASVFTNPEVLLRVWFDDGANGSQLLTPDQRIPRPDTTADDHAGQVRRPTDDTWHTLDPTPAARAGHTAVWTGSEMIVCGGGGENGDSEFGGRFNPSTNTWTAMSTVGAPTARGSHTAVWTGGEMIVWGGRGFTGTLNDGGRYNPGSDSWTAVTTTAAPASRTGHTAVWTGAEMIVWGGEVGSGTLSDGARYSPGSDSWAVVTTIDAPTPRAGHTAVWTGSQMIVWGGQGSSGASSPGGRYNPGSDSWTVVTTTDAPTSRAGHTAVWTGSQMLVWGGVIFGPGGGFFGDGGRYDPAANRWTAMTTTGAPTAFYLHSAVWTGTEMIAWGGVTTDSDFLYQGGRYNPAADSWTAVSTNAAPVERSYHTAVWTGSEMIVWGGVSPGPNGLRSSNGGGRYSPVANSWTGMTPAPRRGHSAVWTGSEMIVWGGYADKDYPPYLNDGGRYKPEATSWAAVNTVGAPASRSDHTAVWTGSEMIVWGGCGVQGCLSSGRRYDPATDSWSDLNGSPIPAGRGEHSAVWTGSEMILWGGGAEGRYFNDGGRYNPAARHWTPMSTAGAPAPRGSHTAVWTGNEMVVWGGYVSAGGAFGWYNDGGRYNPATNSWTALNTAGAPAARSWHTAVWTGSEMIVWGGLGRGNGGILSPPAVLLNGGGRYDPVRNGWTAVNTTGAPAARALHTAVWTGSEMIVWGGSADSLLNTGGRFTPAGNRWAPMTTVGAPAAREDHTAVWTGSEMIIWGGYISSSNRSFNDMFGYRPSSGVFTITNLVHDGATLTLSFPTITNRTYTLWRSDTLAEGSWSETGLPVLTGTGALGSFAVPATEPASRFFRVQAGP